MEISTQLVHSLLWFVGGAVTYKFLHNLINFGQMNIVFDELNKRIIMLAYHISTDVEFVCKKKYEYLEKSGMDKKEIDFVRSIDDRTLHTWQQTVIRQFFASYPRQMHGLLPFSDWNSAQSYVLETFEEENRQ